eukprot:TRINITY_DN6996_c0_g1_i1.p1 TRINITY_DN6996_c0_g1~~TRINITY_DN6996_c0_g1_i1.p1  ORF type:complete len:349 (+),score=79.58 TRINITY_DN6996_c0_g1_i1:46-1047(+)
MAESALPVKSAKQVKLDEVVIDGLAILKIIKHCRENLPSLVTGQLLGLDFDGRLEVTNCFAFPQQKEESNDEVGAEYQLEMMRCLREVNVDNNTVGWYQSTYLGSFINDALIETQFNYQANISACVCIIYDPLRTAQGTLSLKAIRLTDAFMQMHKSKDFSTLNINTKDFKYGDVFEEVPIKVSNPVLLNALLHEMNTSKDLSHDFDRFDLSTNPFLEKHMEFLIECLDDLSVEQTRQLNYHRQVQRQLQQQQLHIAKRKAESQARVRSGLEPLEEEDPTQNPLFKSIPAPSRLDTLLITSQVHTYARQVNEFAGGALSKLFLLTGVQPQQAE